MAKYAMLTKFPLAKFFPRAIRIETLASSVQHLLGGVSERRILPAFLQAVLQPANLRIRTMNNVFQRGMALKKNL